ncbi:MAG: hypothetical protein EOP24_47370 [Hyphomicrobiales bacterium]|nr:MAG: hypothetical protein EOP24_47370 [Hyphomicrobiales bacterium]
MEELKAQRFAFPVEIDGALGNSFAGYFYPSGGDRRGILQVLIHGNSYDHRYWDAGIIKGRDYSYVRYMTAQGFDLLAVDLPGVGAQLKAERSLLISVRG